MRERLRRLDDRVLGRAGWAWMLILTALAMLGLAIAFLLDDKWPLGIALLVLGAAGSRAAYEEWKRLSSR